MERHSTEGPAQRRWRCLRAARNSSPIDWPAGTQPQGSEVFSHNEAVVAAAPERVWQLLVDAPRWPRWYRNAHAVRLPAGTARLEPGTVFTWVTFAAAITSEVTDFEPTTRLGWTWWRRGARGYHGWLLRPCAQGTLVVTEETQRGFLPWILRPVLQAGLCVGHAYWLRQLGRVAEAPPPPRP